MHPSASYRCILQYEFLGQPVMSGDRQDENQEQRGDYWRVSCQHGKTATLASYYCTPRVQEPAWPQNSSGQDEMLGKGETSTTHRTHSW